MVATRVCVPGGTSTLPIERPFRSAGKLIFWRSVTVFGQRPGVEASAVMFSASGSGAAGSASTVGDGSGGIGALH